MSNSQNCTDIKHLREVAEEVLQICRSGMSLELNVEKLKPLLAELNDIATVTFRPGVKGRVQGSTHILVPGCWEGCVFLDSRPERRRFRWMEAAEAITIRTEDYLRELDSVSASQAESKGKTRRAGPGRPQIKFGKECQEAWEEYQKFLKPFGKRPCFDFGYLNWLNENDSEILEIKHACDEEISDQAFLDEIKKRATTYRNRGRRKKR